MAFMRPEITDKQEWAGIETTSGYSWVPFSVLTKSEAESARRGEFSPLLKYAEGSRVIDSLSSIKKGYGVRVSAPGYMDATEWEVYGNQKEARRRAKELIEEEDEAEEGTSAPGHATIAHAKKKSKAQLNREIAEALARKGTSRGGTSAGGVAHSTKSKKRPSQARVVGRHGLGTADVRTGEGSYWIVTGPTGYRVDYKPWGPSNEVDLGTFPSRKQARAKITTHAGSIGATIVS